MSTSSHPDHLLRQHYRWLKFGWPLIIFATGLVTVLVAVWLKHPTFAKLEKWGSLDKWWSIGVGFSVLGAVGFWLFRRRSLEQNAQRLDARLDAKNRLEAAVVLQGASDPIALAQREETVDFLSRTPIQSREPLLLGLIVLGFLLLFAHLVTLVSWTRPWQAAPVAKKPTAPAIANQPSATITWISPEAESKASSVEEVPLEAVAESTSGLRNLTLEIAVNGQPHSHLPVAVAELEKTGKHPITASVYLDQLEVQPYDMVSYYLSAQRIFSEKLSDTTSPVQFIQIKPFRDDVREMPGGDGKSGFPLIKALKVAQLRLLKENFLLTHAEISHEHPSWKKQNAITGSEQTILMKKTEEVIVKLIEDGVAAEIVNLVSQAKPLMAEAGTKITAEKNADALIPQGKALATITEVEKFFIKVVAKGKGKPGPNVKDPFKDQKELELKQRFQTKAGELELLAKEQTRLAEDVAKNEPTPVATPPQDATKKLDPNQLHGTLAERQTQVSQRIGALLTGKVFTPAITEHLEKAQEKARESLRHLDADVQPAASDPAAVAAQKLRLALQEMNKAGEEEAKDQLTAAMRALSQAADQASQAAKENSEKTAREKADDAAQKATQTKNDLAQAAMRQQETGSAAAAAKLAEVANAVHQPKVQDALQKLQEKPQDAALAEAAANQLRQLAEQAAQSPTTGKPSPAEIAKLIASMERTRANLQRLAAEAGNAAATPGKANDPAGQKKGTSETPGKGEGKEKAEGEGKGEGEGKAGGEGKAPGEENGKGEGGNQGQGEGSGGGTTDSATQASSAMSSENLEKLSQEVFEQIREQVLQANTIVPKSTEVSVLSRTVNKQNFNAATANVVQFFSEIARPLDGLITLLRDEMKNSRREFSIISQNPGQAPALYRPAVADYFEQLSEDYEGSSKKPSPSPTPEKSSP